MSPHTVPNRLPYRAKDGAILGVCLGIARWRELPVFWVRFFMVVVILLTGFLPGILLYIGLALMMKPDPNTP